MKVQDLLGQAKLQGKRQQDRGARYIKRSPELKLRMELLGMARQLRYGQATADEIVQEILNRKAGK